MNESYTLLEPKKETPLPNLASAVQAVTSAAHRPLESSRISSAELARKVLKLTGSVRLVSRSAHHWHHCGINE